jgi:hypothetical protein
MLLTANKAAGQVRYYFMLEGGQELGPYATYEQAAASAATIPLREGSGTPVIYPKTIAGDQLLFG